MNTADFIRGSAALADAANGLRRGESIAALKADYVAGRISLAEFEERVARSMEITEASAAPAWDCDLHGHVFLMGDPYCSRCGILHGA